MLDNEQQRILDEMIKSQSQHNELMKSQNQNEKGIVFGCSTTFLVFGIAALVFFIFGAKQVSDSWGFFVYLAGIILSSIGILGLISPYIVCLSNNFNKWLKGKWKNSIPNNDKSHIHWYLKFLKNIRKKESVILTSTIIFVIVVIVSSVQIVDINRSAATVYEIRLDEEEFSNPDTQNSLRVSPDTSKFAYIIEYNGKYVVNLDGEKQREYDSIATESIVFSPDSERFAYIANQNDKWFTVIDGEKQKEYDSIASESIVFSPDSEKIAYVAEDNGVWFVIVDGEKTEECYRTAVVSFSNDSQSVSYGPPNFNFDNNEYKAVSPDGKRKAIITTDYHYNLFLEQVYELWLEVDGTRVKELEGRSQIRNLVFSPDGEHLIYIATTAPPEKNGKHYVMVDETGSSKYSFIYDETLFFDAPKIMHYIAEKGSKLYLVVMKLK